MLWISQVQLYPALHEDNVKNLQFFRYDHFEDLLAAISSKNFCFLAGVVSKIFAIEN